MPASAGSRLWALSSASSSARLSGRRWCRSCAAASTCRLSPSTAHRSRAFSAAGAPATSADTKHDEHGNLHWPPLMHKTDFSSGWSQR